MAKFEIPNQGQVRQVNRGDIFGELWSTFNIDLTSSPGKIKTSRQLYKSISEGKMLNGNLVASVVYDGFIYNILSNDYFQRIESSRNPRISATWLASGSSVFVTDSDSDAVVFDGKLLVSRGTNIQMNSNAAAPSWDEDWWTAVTLGTALDSLFPHVMHVSRIGQETLFVTDGPRVRYYNLTSGHSKVQLQEDLVACCIATDYKATFVGTYSNSGDAYVYEIYIGETADIFDRDTGSIVASSAVARNAYRVDGSAVLSMDVIDGVVYIVTDRGHIQAFNGVTFVTVGSFPFAFDSVALDGMTVGAIDSSNVDRAIHPKGMRAYGKSLLINVNTNNQLIDDLAANAQDNDDVFNNVVVNERSASGVWEFDTETKVLNHRYSFKYSPNQVGFHRLQTSAPILVLNNQYTRILTGGRCVSTQTDVFVENPDQVPTGYFITPEIDSQNVQDAWSHLSLKLEELEEGESVEIKYRTNKRRGYPAYASGTFADAKTFNTTDDLSMVQEGDEIELIDGNYAGKMAQVVKVTASDTVYSIELDRDIAITGETCYARFQNWQLAIVEDNGQFIKTGVGDASTWVQFKVVLTGNIEVRALKNRGNSKNEL